MGDALLLRSLTQGADLVGLNVWLFGCPLDVLQFGELIFEPLDLILQVPLVKLQVVDLPLCADVLLLDLQRQIVVVVFLGSQLLLQLFGFLRELAVLVLILVPHLLDLLHFRQRLAGGTLHIVDVSTRLKRLEHALMIPPHLLLTVLELALLHLQQLHLLLQQGILLLEFLLFFAHFSFEVVDLHQLLSAGSLVLRHQRVHVGDGLIDRGERVVEAGRMAYLGGEACVLQVVRDVALEVGLERGVQGEGRGRHGERHVQCLAVGLCALTKAACRPACGLVRSGCTRARRRALHRRQVAAQGCRSWVPLALQMRFLRVRSTWLCVSDASAVAIRSVRLNWGGHRTPSMVGHPISLVGRAEVMCGRNVFHPVCGRPGSHRRLRRRTQRSSRPHHLANWVLCATIGAALRCGAAIHIKPPTVRPFLLFSRLRPLLPLQWKIYTPRRLHLASRRPHFRRPSCTFVILLLYQNVLAFH